MLTVVITALIILLSAPLCWYWIRCVLAMLRLPDEEMDARLARDPRIVRRLIP
jgi:hypothetical protein